MPLSLQKIGLIPVCHSFSICALVHNLNSPINNFTCFKSINKSYTIVTGRSQSLLSFNFPQYSRSSRFPKSELKAAPSQHDLSAHTRGLLDLWKFRWSLCTVIEICIYFNKKCSNTQVIFIIFTPSKAAAFINLNRVLCRINSWATLIQGQCLLKKISKFK